MPSKTNGEDDPDGHPTLFHGDGALWHRTHPITRPETYGPTHSAILKKPRFRHSHALPVTMAVKSAALPADVALLRKELSLYKTLADCPFICNCFGDEITYSGDTKMGFVNIHNLLLEYSYCNLGLLIGDRDRLSEGQIRRTTRDILEGVSFIHSRGYVHCGLNPEILLIFDRGDRITAKIGDLGLAKRANEKKTRVKMNDNVKKNLRYLAPEVVGERSHEGPADVWAVGCIVMEMLTGRSLWDGRTDKEVEEGLLRTGRERAVVGMPNGVSEDAQGFLKGCLDRKASRRSTAMMLLNHPFVASDGGEI